MVVSVSLTLTPATDILVEELPADETRWYGDLVSFFWVHFLGIVNFGGEVVSHPLALAEARRRIILPSLEGVRCIPRVEPVGYQTLIVHPCKGRCKRTEDPGEKQFSSSDRPHQPNEIVRYSNLLLHDIIHVDLQSDELIPFWVFCPRGRPLVVYRVLDVVVFVSCSEMKPRSLVCQEILVNGRENDERIFLTPLVVYHLGVPLYFSLIVLLQVQ